MAKKKNQQTRTKLEEINDSLSGFEQKIEKHKKLLFWIVGGLIVIALAIFAYHKFVTVPNEQKANKELAVADECLRNAQMQPENSKKDSLQALEQYQAIAKKYSNDAGNRAKLMAGQILYAQGKYDEAQKYLEDYTPKGKIVGPMSQALLGDLYVNQKQYDKAIEQYDKAMKLSRNSVCSRIKWVEIFLYIMAIIALVVIIYFARSKDKSSLRRWVLIVLSVVLVASAGFATYLLLNHLKNVEETRGNMPYLMEKKARVLEFNGKYDDALKIYEEIEAKYTGPNSMSMPIERVKAKSGK